MCDMSSEQIWAYVGGLKFARSIIEKERKRFGKGFGNELIDDFSVNCLAKMAGEIARYEPGHDKPANAL